MEDDVPVVQGDWTKAIEVYYNKVSVDNCVIKDCSVNGVYLNNSEFGSFTANTISDCEEYPLVIPFLRATAVTSENEISSIGICLTGENVGKKNGKMTVHEQTLNGLNPVGENELRAVILAVDGNRLQ